MLNKLILFLLLTLTFSTVKAQSNFWITNPSIKGKLTLQNGWVLSDTSAGGIKFSGNVWIGGSQLFFGTGGVVKDSSGYIIFNKGIKTRPLSGDPGIAAWINNSMLIDSSITKDKIKKGTITTAEIAPTLKDSIFSSKPSGVLDLDITTLKNRVDKLFNSKGDFNTSVFGGVLIYDTTSQKVKFDTNYVLKARDSLKYLATSGVDTSILLQKKDTLRFTSSTSFLPRSDTVKFLKFSDTTNFIKISDSTRYLTKTYLDTSTIVRKADTTRYWARANYNPNLFYNTNNLDTSNLAKKSELSGSIDSTSWWNKINHPTSRYWNFNNKDTNRYYSVRNLDTSKIWNIGKNPPSAYWNTTTFDTINYWSIKRQDTTKYWTKARLDTNKYWNKFLYDPTKYFSSRQGDGTNSIYLDTTTLLKRNQSDIYWSRIDSATKLDTAKLTHTADSSYWRKTNLDTNKYISVNDVDTTVIKFNSNKITIKDYTIDPKKIDSTKLGKGIKFNTGTNKLEVRYDSKTMSLDSAGISIKPKTTMMLKWEQYFDSNVLDDLVLSRVSGGAPDIYGYGMPFDGHIEFISMDDQANNTVMVFKFRSDEMPFDAETFLNVNYYGSTPYEFQVMKKAYGDGSFTALWPDHTIAFVPSLFTTVTFMMKIVFDAE